MNEDDYDHLVGGSAALVEFVHHEAIEIFGAVMGPLVGPVMVRAGKGSFDSANRFAKRESVGCALDDRVGGTGGLAARLKSCPSRLFFTREWWWRKQTAGSSTCRRWRSGLRSE